MEEWNKGELDSFLIEITANILKFKDDKGDYLVEKIRDAAGQVCKIKITVCYPLNNPRKVLENGLPFQLWIRECLSP